MNQYLQLFKETVKEFGEDKAPRLGAALAYYTIFSIAPLLLIAIAIAGMVFGDEAARGGITRELGNVMGVQTANVVEEMVANAGKPKAGIAATIIGVIMLLFGASGVFGQLKDALNTIWNVEAKKAGGIMGFVRQRFLSMTMVMGVAFLLLVSLVLDAALSGMNDYLDRMVPGGALLVQAIQIVISFGAEYTQVYARRHGSMKGDRSKIEARQRGQRVDPPKSAPALQLKSEGRRGGGGKAKLAVGGLAGLVIGALIGGITAGIVAVKSVKKLLTLPFK